MTQHFQVDVARLIADKRAHDKARRWRVFCRGNVPSGKGGGL